MNTLFGQAVRAAVRSVQSATPGTVYRLLEVGEDAAVVQLVFEGRTCADVRMVEQCFRREGMDVEVRVMTGPAPCFDVTARVRGNSSLRLYRASQRGRLAVGLLCVVVITGLLVSLRLRTEWY